MVVGYYFCCCCCCHPYSLRISTLHALASTLVNCSLSSNSFSDKSCWYMPSRQEEDGIHIFRKMGASTASYQHYWTIPGSAGARPNPSNQDQLVMVSLVPWFPWAQDRYYDTSELCSVSCWLVTLAKWIVCPTFASPNAIVARFG